MNRTVTWARASPAQLISNGQQSVSQSVGREGGREGDLGLPVFELIHAEFIVREGFLDEQLVYALAAATGELAARCST